MSAAVQRTVKGVAGKAGNGDVFAEIIAAALFDRAVRTEKLRKFSACLYLLAARRGRITLRHIAVLIDRNGIVGDLENRRIGIRYVII